MRFIDRIERKMGRFYISGLMKYICLIMLGLFLLDLLPLGRISAYSLLYFDRDLILSGQVWRIVTFMLLPPDSSIIFIVFVLYFYFFLGTTLENRWGSRRFNLYYLIGWLCSVAGGFIAGTVTNYYMNLSLFLAFAMAYPEMKINLFFFIPIEVKYIALFDAVYMLCIFFMLRGWQMKVCMLLCILPFFLFYGDELWYMCRRLMKTIRRRLAK